MSAWVVGEEPPSFKSLKGRSALLELLDPDDVVSEGLASRTVEIAARAAERKLVVVSVAVGEGAQEATARAFAERARVTWALGVDRRGETFFAAGSPGLPRYFFVAPDGTVVWEGSPASLDDALLDALLERSRMWRPDEVARGARQAAAAYARGRFGEAWAKARKVLEEVAARREAGHPVEEGLERDAGILVGAVEATAELRLAIAARLQKERWGLESLEAFEAMEAAFRGTPWEEKARAGREGVRADARAMYEAEATRRMRGVLEKLRPLTRRTVERAVEALEKLAEDYGDTVTGKRARAEADRLRKLLRTVTDR